MKSIVILIPVFNEEQTITHNLSEILRYSYEHTDVDINFLIIDDGSTDNTVKKLHQLCKENQRVNLLCLNRNFGKEAAIYAGLCTIKSSDAVILMDSDLQHPPSLFAEMIRLWREEGYKVVEACKKSRGAETATKKMLVSFYYYIFDFFTGLSIKNQSDYKLLDKKVVDCYCLLPEQNRFFRGLINWMNFETAQIYFDVPVYSDNMTSWSHWKLFKYAISSITSFTSFPLHIVTLFGIITFIISLVIGGIAFYDKISGNAVDGFTTVILLLLFIGSILMFSLGLIGIYIAKIYDGIKNRPAYIINKRTSYINDNIL